jgi:copper chaperone CopZ
LLKLAVKPEADGPMELALEVNGMTCRSFILFAACLRRCAQSFFFVPCSDCSLMIENTLNALPGILNLQISVMTAQAEIAYEPKTLSSEQIIQKITSLGFTTKFLSSASYSPSKQKKAPPPTTLSLLLHNHSLASEGDEAHVTQLLATAVRGITSVRLTLPPQPTLHSAQLHVTFNPALVPPRRVLRAVQQLLHCTCAVLPPGAAGGGAAAASDAASDQWKKQFQLCVALCFPVVLCSYILPAAEVGIVTDQFVPGLSVATLVVCTHHTAKRSVL